MILTAVAMLIACAGMVSADDPEVEFELVDEWTATRVASSRGVAQSRSVYLASEEDTIRPIYEAEREYRERFPEGDASEEETDAWWAEYPAVTNLNVSVIIDEVDGGGSLWGSLTFDHWLQTRTDPEWGTERTPRSIRLRFEDGSWFTVEGLGLNRNDPVIQSSWFSIEDDMVIRSLVEEMAARETLIVEVPGVGGVPRRHRFDLRHVHEWIAETRQWALAVIDG